MEAKKHVLSGKKDIISRMPDLILIHILSFLRAREAVCTGQLSKRWTDLWAYSPFVNLDAEEFEPDDLAFERFANALLLNRKNSRLDTFKLKWRNGESKTITSWIRYSVKSKPRVLSIYCRWYDQINLPHSMFCCATLEEVQLIICDELPSEAIIPRSIDLPILRKLTLGTNMRIRPEFMQKLLHGCPLLEELKLERCFLFEMEIYSPVLKRLILVDCDGHSMFISCPGLLNLDLELYSSVIRFANLTSLENAFIHFPVTGMDCYEILSSLSNATIIKLFGKQFRTIFTKELAKCSTFKNLRELVLDECLNSRKVDIMAFFGRFSPNLDKSCFRDIEVERTMEKAIDAPEHDGDAYNDEGDDIYSNDDEDQDEAIDAPEHDGDAYNNEGDDNYSNDGEDQDEAIDASEHDGDAYNNEGSDNYSNDDEDQVEAIDAPEHDGDAYTDEGDDNYSNDDEDQDEAIDAPEHDGDAYNDEGDDNYSNDDEDQDEAIDAREHDGDAYNDEGDDIDSNDDEDEDEDEDEEYVD